MVTRTLEPVGKGQTVSTKQPPGPRSVVRVEKRAPDLSSTTSAAAVNMCRAVPRRSVSSTSTALPMASESLRVDELCIISSFGQPLMSCCGVWFKLLHQEPHRNSHGAVRTLFHANDRAEKFFVC